MRIAMIGARGLPSLGTADGGIESHVETLSKRLVERGHSVTVYVRSYANTKHRKVVDGVRLVTFPTVRQKHLDTFLYALFSTIHSLFQRFDIIHYHGVGPTTLSWIPRLFTRSKIVSTFHSHNRFHEKWGMLAKWYLLWAEWATCAFPHLTIAVSHPIQVFCRHMYDRDAVYIPNGVDLPDHAPAESIVRSLGLEPHRYFMTLGRLVPLKAQDDAIRAFVEVDTNMKLAIVGDAPYDANAYSKHLAQLAGIDARVVLLGRRSGEELAALLAYCYAFIHPSRTEGLPVAVLEAMSYARMVIMSDIPGNRELVDHSGVAYPVGNIRALQDCIQWSLTDQELVQLRGVRAKDIVTRLYSWDRIVEKTEHEYSRV